MLIRSRSVCHHLALRLILDGAPARDYSAQLEAAIGLVSGADTSQSRVDGLVASVGTRFRLESVGSLPPEDPGRNGKRSHGDQSKGPLIADAASPIQPARLAGSNRRLLATIRQFSARSAATRDCRTR